MTGRGRILIVDDEPFIRDVVAFDLTREGYDVVEAEDGEDAFAKIMAARPDLVVSDVRMPVASGTELLRRIKAADPHQPFIFMTAFADVSADEALDQGAEAFLNKPLDRADLLAAVAQALVSRSERWRNAEAYADAPQLLAPSDDLLNPAASHLVILGSGGAFIAMEQNLPSSLAIVAFEIDAALARPLRGTGRVRWVRHQGTPGFHAGIGLEFLHLDEESRRTFLGHLDAACPRAYVPLGARR